MAKYEVHIPATDPGSLNITLKVNADNWMAALKAGMQKLGEQGAVSQNVMVDIQEDNSIHVTEPMNGRVFRIRELSEEEAAQAPVKKSAVTKPPARRTEVKTETGVPAVERPVLDKTLITSSPTPLPAQAPPPPPLPRSADLAQVHTPPPGLKPLKPAASGIAATVPAAPSARAAVKTKPGNKSMPRMPAPDVEELEHPIKPVTGTIGRARVQSGVNPSLRQSTEDLLADVFMRIADLDTKATIYDAMDFILTLAMEKVPCEAGSVLRADGATGDLTFLVAKGPKSKELMASKLVIPAGSGIAGFCSYEGVSVAVSEVQKDPRFYAGVGQKVDYSTRSLLCAPMMTHGRSFGCVQVLNRTGGPQFLEQEVGVVAYLSHQAALYLNARI
jgi:hypothetical protein